MQMRESSNFRCRASIGNFQAKKKGFCASAYKNTLRVAKGIFYRRLNVSDYPWYNVELMTVSE